MAGAAAFASSPKKYHVFISFRGEDTRKTFTCHLYHAFGLQKIKAYIDEESLEKGDEITPSLLEAIADSEISLVILSKNYASSRWCLDELDQILRCKERNKQIVVPVFYYVDPSDVRKQHSYASAFAAHEIRFKDQMDKVQQWRNSLKAVADLSGFNSSESGSDAKLVETVVEDIKKKLRRILMLPSNDSKDLVGIENRIRDVETKLNMGSSGVHILGIWGMGGIGKTTLARAVFDKFAPQFDNYCFLENVREKFKTGRLHELETKLFSEILLSEKKSLYMISPFVKDRLRHAKVFLVLDDIDDHIEQWEKFVGEIHGWFGSGSKIIVTSRDKKVFEKIKTNEIYEVEGLSFDESLHLFCLKAFKQSSPRRDKIDLSRRAIRYVGGLPLALSVLGSLLGPNDTNDVWKSALDKLEKYPDQKIHKVLEISYDGLDENDKQIFLDIAFFFKGEERNFVIQMLDGFGRFGEIGIRNLTDRSIITVENDIIQMHDLLQQMGKRIVEEESKSNPGRRSRLSSTEDILKVLKYNGGTEAIQGISLWTRQIEDVPNLEPGVFERMHNLKYLKFDNGENCLNFPEGLNSLPDELRYLSWNYYPLKSLPSKFNPCNLIELDLSDNKLEHLWDGVQNLANLKLLDLNWSRNLIQIPNLSRALKLRKMNLTGCTCLENLPSSISKLESLQSLYLSECYNINKFPELPVYIEYLDMSETSIEQVPSSIGRLLHLRDLQLHECFRLECLLEIPKHLTDFSIGRSGIRTLPSSISNLTGLTSLYLSGCEKLESLPPALSTDLPYWNEVNLDYTNVSEIPDWLFRLPVLEELSLRESGIRTIPASIKHSKLCKLDIKDCKSLEDLPELPVSIERVDASGCTSLQRILNASTDTRSISISKTLTAYYEHLSFNNCLSLDHRYIISEFQIRALRFNFLPRPKEFKLSRSNSMYWPSICISFSGDEIPGWFNYQNPHGNSILFPPQCYDKTNFMGFASCVVVELILCNSQRQETYCKLSWDVTVQTNNGKKCYTFETIIGDSSTKDLSNRVLMCYLHASEIDLVSAKEISFVFHTVPWLQESLTYKVKRCGIRMLQVQDAVDFGIRITEYVHWKDNIITNEDTDEDERSELQSVNLETNELPPKRTKFSSSP